jgi:hypothetical protein
MLNEETKITWFDKAKGRSGKKLVTLDFFIDMTMNTLSNPVKEYRERLKDENFDYTKFKQDKIPLIQFQIGEYINPLMCIDYEESNVNIPIECVFIRGKSLGGKDEFIVIRLPDRASKDKSSYDAVAKAVEKYLNIPSQNGQASTDRGRFITYDPKLFINWQCEPFDVPELPEVASSELIHYSSGGATNEYDNPQQVAAIIRKSKTLGVQIKSLHNWAVHVAGAFNQKGVSQEYGAIQVWSKIVNSEFIKTKPHYNYDYFKRAWDDVYKRYPHQHNVKIERKIHDEIGFNEITRELTYKGKRLDDKTAHELWWEIPDKFRPKFEAYWHELKAKSIRWNPLDDFFKIPWSGEDQFQKLEKYIDTDPEFVYELKRHIIRGINMIFEKPDSKNKRVNRYVFVLQGESHIGKSELLRKITLSNSIDGFSSEFQMSMNSKDMDQLLCTVPNLINEEVDNVSAWDVKSLKPIISYAGGLIRLPYDKVPTQFRRIATLWASVNPNEFLQTVDNRWVIFEIKGIDFQYTNNVDFSDMWRQCYAMYLENPLAGEISRDQIKSISEKAEAYRVIGPLEQFINTYFKPAGKNQVMSLDSIRQCVSICYKNINDKALSNAINNCYKNHYLGRKQVEGVRGRFFSLQFFPPKGHETNPQIPSTVYYSEDAERARTIVEGNDPPF